MSQRILLLAVRTSDRFRGVRYLRRGSCLSWGRIWICSVKICGKSRRKNCIEVSGDGREPESGRDRVLPAALSCQYRAGNPLSGTPDCWHTKKPGSGSYCHGKKCMTTAGRPGNYLPGCLLVSETGVWARSQARVVSQRFRSTSTNVAVRADCMPLRQMITVSL